MNRGAKDVLVSRSSNAMFTNRVRFRIISLRGTSLTTTRQFPPSYRFLSLFVSRVSVCDIKVSVNFHFV